MNRTIVDIHILQTVPPSNLNRDDTGSPKTATYGGVRRARVSSQAWKKATRDAFDAYLDESELGTRTKRVVETLAERIEALEPDITAEDARKAAEAVFTAAKIKLTAPPAKKGAQTDVKVAKESDYLLFLSAQQLDAAARLAIESHHDGEKPDGKQAHAILKNDNSIDLALFGRMVADVTDLNVDASCQVAHALSTHAVESEYDYFTAVDDQKAAHAGEDAGAGMIGTVEFNSATLYRYATIDANLLSKNLGEGEATRRAVEAFLCAFVYSMPSGKINTFANHTTPDAVYISVREDRPVSYVGAFENAIPNALTGGRVEPSVAALSKYAREVAEDFGDKSIRCWVSGVGKVAAPLEELGERVAFAEAVVAVGGLVAERLDAAPAVA